MRQAVILDAVRTPRGAARRWGALRAVKAVDLLGPLYHALSARGSLDVEQVEEIILGCVTQVGDQGANIARISSLHIGWPEGIAGQTINSFCTSALTAVATAAAHIQAGHTDMAIAGGVESMSRAPMMSDEGAWYRDPVIMQSTRFVPLGVAADLLASLAGFTREQLDEYACESHRRAARAQAAGCFDRSLVPVRDVGGGILLDRDEMIRRDVSMESLAALAPAFAAAGAEGADRLALQRYLVLEKIAHLHTAGSSPAMVDGAALILLADREAAEAQGLTPRARVVTTASAAVEPIIMLTAGKLATRRALAKADLSVSDIDLFECNEGFAAVPLDYQRDLNISRAQLNVNGGAIAMGHPMGASGAILLGTLLDELERREQRFGLAALCGGAGLGAAMLIERLPS